MPLATTDLPGGDFCRSSSFESFVQMFPIQISSLFFCSMGLQYERIAERAHPAYGQDLRF